ncbi:MAG: hypothetical protein AUK27_07945 [Deltaproteobacteria bacterium CG2_30_66_27]|nr:MAG: hypothetical protein AUK27_07945 [Deltaproteobacteria bacterium CG2_30_66_27]PJB32802.1 MAG: hypothetical protein CO109_02630 [Deltaproteobacteria bacterium CG_4_9_14_3_um_filter_65_9]
MRKIWVLGLVGVLAVVLAGCGGGSSGPDLIVFEQVSDQTVDADIGYTGAGSPFISPATSTGTIQIGVDGGGTEYRGFLDFPMAGKIPYDADVQSAYVEVFVASVPFGANVPVLVELVDFPLPLIATDYFRVPPSPYLPAVLSRSIFTLRPSDAVFPRPSVRIEVTNLVREALQRAQPEFQLRILLDPTIPGPGIVQLDDDVAQTAPFLHVEYF